MKILHSSHMVKMFVTGVEHLLYIVDLQMLSLTQDFSTHQFPRQLSLVQQLVTQCVADVQL